MVRFAVRVREIPGSNPGGPTTNPYIILDPEKKHVYVPVSRESCEKICRLLLYLDDLTAFPEAVNITVAYRVQCP